MDPNYILMTGLIAAALYLPLAAAPVGWPRSALKTLPLVFFTVAAYVGDAPGYLVSALLFSALGDFALSRRGEAAFLYGLASFALAHLVFMLTFLDVSRAYLWEGFLYHPAAAVMMLMAAVSTELWLQPRLNGLRWPVRAYVAVITLMVFAALTVPVPVIYLGAVLFAASDILAAVLMFRISAAHPQRTSIAWVAWASYIGGQCLILTGFLPLP